jgi:hypothetical protein
MQGSQSLRIGAGTTTDSAAVPPPSQPPAPAPEAAPEPVSHPAEDPVAEPVEEALLTPEQEAAQQSERDVKALIVAYQRTLEKVDDMPALVWISWARTGPGKYLKVPYLRWFLRFFVAHHVSRNLTALSRRLHSNAALAADSDANRSSRDMIKLYQQSLPSPPYRNLIFAVIAAALVIALPLQAIGNVFYVLDLVGAVLRVDVSYLGRAFASKELLPTVRSLLVLLIGLIVVGGLLTSPFGLKRALLNLYPWTDEDFGQTAARSHGYRVDGIYALEAKVCDHLGAKQPLEGRWDLGFQTALLVCLVVVELMLILVTTALALRLPIFIDIDIGGDGPVYEFSLPDLPWWNYGLVTGLVFVACVLLIWRLVGAWKVRRRPKARPLSDRPATPPA